MPKRSVLLGLGGNVGDATVNFNAAIAGLERCGFRVVARSTIHRTAPVGMPVGTPDFFNAALLGEWDGTPQGLLACTQAVEAEGGRPNDHVASTDRPIDIDILLFGDEIIQSPDLTIPHPRFHLRRFALAPAAELVPNRMIPGVGKPIAECLVFLG